MLNYANDKNWISFNTFPRFKTGKIIIFHIICSFKFSKNFLPTAFLECFFHEKYFWSKIPFFSLFCFNLGTTKVGFPEKISNFLFQPLLSILRVSVCKHDCKMYICCFWRGGKSRRKQGERERKGCTGRARGRLFAKHWFKHLSPSLITFAHSPISVKKKRRGKTLWNSCLTLVLSTCFLNTLRKVYLVLGLYSFYAFDEQRFFDLAESEVFWHVLLYTNARNAK